ncbi:GNAT family N-acetyltransferase [Tundrisphaera lichenicola]|uniref:GNAT family N-acetyltransferase n=1 Tax=Tundrisphaera lichenicola TaxID=2029860 RepID=UPI003EBD0FA7
MSMSGANRLISPCPPDWRREALEVLYRRVPATLRPRLILDALAEAEAGRIDLSGLWVARRRGRIVGTLLTQSLAGRAAAIWSPEVGPSWGRAALAASLIRNALNDLREKGYRIAQALVDASAPRTAASDLIRGGLPRVTALTYMHRETTRPIARSLEVNRPAFDWRPFGEETEAEFREVLQTTYLGSLDMPELEGIRSLDDVMASHRAAGRFDPTRWRVGTLPGEPEARAVLLLSEVPDRPAWEVAYLGLSPQARGRGLGRSALAYALDQARPHVPRLELAVDDRNRPARRLYDAAGFLEFDRRFVHLAVLNDNHSIG